MEGLGLEPDLRWEGFVKKGAYSPPQTITAGLRNFPEALDAMLRMKKWGYHDMNMGQMELMARHLVNRTKPTEAELQDYALSPGIADLFTDHEKLAALSGGVTTSLDEQNTKAREVEGYTGPARDTAEKAGEMIDDGKGGFTPATAADPKADQFGYGYMSESNRQGQDLMRVRHLIDSLGKGNPYAGDKYNDGVGADGQPKAYLYDHLFDFTPNYGSANDWNTFFSGGASPDTALGAFNRFSTGNTLDPVKNLVQHGMEVESRTEPMLKREQMLDITSVVPPTLANAASTVISAGMGAIHGDRDRMGPWEWSQKRAQAQENAHGLNPYNTGTNFQERQDKQQEARDVHRQQSVLDARNTAKINTGRDLSYAGNLVSELAPEVVGDAFTWASAGLGGALTATRLATKGPRVALKTAGNVTARQAGNELAEETLTGGALMAGLQAASPQQKANEAEARKWLQTAPQREKTLQEYIQKNRPEY